MARKPEKFTLCEQLMFDTLRYINKRLTDQRNLEATWSELTEEPDFYQEIYEAIEQ